ncbi:hypothetical protein NESM_000914300 [Novymonas esmeraldas]|uniref:Uncharacterized protein n=1 Tax=Novymonas esmeraldas TaxID=1808958 RepID=A0AAW0EYG9_9TRYP
MKPTNARSRKGSARDATSPATFSGICHQKYSGSDDSSRRVSEMRAGVGTAHASSGVPSADSSVTHVTSSSVDTPLRSGTNRCSPCATPSKNGDAASSAAAAAVRTAGGTLHSTPAIIRVYPPCCGTPTHRSTPRAAASSVLVTSDPTMQSHALRLYSAACTARDSRSPHSCARTSCVGGGSSSTLSRSCDASSTFE